MANASKENSSPPAEQLFIQGPDLGQLGRERRVGKWKSDLTTRTEVNAKKSFLHLCPIFPKTLENLSKSYKKLQHIGEVIKTNEKHRKTIEKH